MLLTLKDTILLTLKDTIFSFFYNFLFMMEKNVKLENDD
jgi:hypothetical protein